WADLKRKMEKEFPMIRKQDDEEDVPTPEDPSGDVLSQIDDLTGALQEKADAGEMDQEECDQVCEYLTNLRDKISTTKARGKGKAESGPTAQDLNKRAARRIAKSERLTVSEAYAKVFQDDPEIYRRYVRETMRNIKY